jgi:hypothetical protein
MDKETLITIVKPQMTKYLLKGWKEVTLNYIKEKWLGEYIVDFITDQGKKESICPSEYIIDTKESKALDEYLTFTKLDERCNKLRVILYSNGDSKVEHSWDNAAYEQSQNMGDYHKKQNKKRVKQSSKKTKEDFHRFQRSNNSSGQEKIFDIPLSNTEIISNTFARLFSLFDSKPAVIMEGFSQSIRDKKNDLEFSIELNQFGLSYYADEKDKLAQESISIFHTTLFSKSLDLKKCDLSYSSDFGMVKIGFDGKKLFYQEENDDNRM